MRRLLLLGAGLLAMLVAALFQFTPARADDGAVGAVGEGVVPLTNNQVIMASERVDAEIRGFENWVTCVFTFTNSGPATDVLMGFPQLGSTRNTPPPMLDFTSAVDGVAVPVTFKPQATANSYGEVVYSGWHTFAVSFGAGQTRIVRNTYHGLTSWLSNGDRMFDYVLHTGASWLGPIGQADIYLRWQSDRDVPPGSPFYINPKPTETGLRALHWHFTNLEPTTSDDISASFRPMWGLHNMGWGARVSSGNLGLPTDYVPNARSLISDGDIRSAWISQGESSGAWIDWHQTGPFDATPGYGLGILPGVAGDPQAYSQHGRPKELLIRYAQLKPGLNLNVAYEDYLASPPPEMAIVEQRITLADSPRWQFARLAVPARAEQFKVEVLSVYPGSSYDDVAIAELLFPLIDQDLALEGTALPPTGAPILPNMLLWPLLLLAAGLTLRVLSAHAARRTVSS